MKTTLSKTLRRMIPGFLLGFAVLLGMALFGDVKSVIRQAREFNWLYYPLVILFTLMNYLLRFFKWHYYLGQVGVKDFSRKESLRLFVAGFPLAMTPGKVGEALKGLWLKQKTGTPLGRGVSVVLAERISDGLAVLMLSTLGVVAYPQYWPAFLSVLAALLGVVILSQIRPLALWLLNIAGKLPLVGRFAGTLHDFYEGSFSLFRPRATLFGVGLGMVSWLGEGIGLYIVLLGLGIAPSLQTLALAIFVLSFSTVIGAVSTSPGGLLAADAAIAGLLTLTLSLEHSQAAVAALLIRLATLWFGVGLGFVVWLFSADLLGMQESGEEESSLEETVSSEVS